MTAGAFPVDVARARHILAVPRGPFELIAGRGIVDARGGLIATVRAGYMVDAQGYVIASGEAPALGRGDADDMTHAVAYALSLACSRTLTLSQLRKGSGFPRGARFIMVQP